MKGGESMEEILNGLKSAIENLEKALECGLDEESVYGLINARQDLINIYVSLKEEK